MIQGNKALIRHRIHSYLLYTLCLLVHQLSLRGGSIHKLMVPFVNPPTAPPLTTTHNNTIPPPKNNPLTTSMSHDKCVFMVYLHEGGPSLSPCAKWHQWNQKGEVGREMAGRPVFAVPTASSIPWDRELEAYRSEKLLKKGGKKSTGFRKQSLVGK